MSRPRHAAAQLRDNREKRLDPAAAPRHGAGKQACKSVSNFAAAASAAIGLLIASGCATAPASHIESRTISAAKPSTQPVLDSCVNDATVEFDSSWSPFRFAAQSNSVTVKLTTPAPPLAPAPATAPAPIPATLASGASDVLADRGGATPDAIRGGASIDAVRGYAQSAALRGSSSAQDIRGNAQADAARGSFTVAVVRGDSQSIAARHDNSSAVVRPDLTVTLQADPPAAAPGDTVLYKIDIKNISSIEARDVTVTDYLPEQMEILSASGASIVADPDDSSTHLAVPGAISPGGSVAVQLVARVKPSVNHP